MKLFSQKLFKLQENGTLKKKTVDKIHGWYLDEVTELRWALRVALDRYDMADLDKAEAILAKYDEIGL
jgi:hypothetical protein